MKKILLLAGALIASYTTSVVAQTFSIGVTGTAMYYDASGTETVKSSNQKNGKDENGVAPMASLFIEAELDQGITVGLDVVPYGANVADASNARDDTDTDDASDTAGTNKVDVNFKNHITLYADIPMNNGLYAKVGLSRVTVETDETVATGSKYGDEDITGVSLGVGMKQDIEDGAFYKIEGTLSRYSGATFNGSADTDSVKNKIELDDFYTAGLRFSIGKSF